MKFKKGYRVKLFVIQISKGGTWEAECLYKGNIREALLYADQVYGHTGVRIKRIKTPAEFDELSTGLNVFGDGVAETEWMN